MRRLSRTRMAWAASAMMSSLRQFSGLTMPPSMLMAAVAMTVRGHSALTPHAPASELLRHAQYAHGHAVLAHGVGRVVLEPGRVQVQRRRQVEDVRVRAVQRR